VGPDLALTNGHCVPEDLRAAGASCAGRVYLHFPEVAGFAAETAECAEVLSSTGGSGLIEKADVAFVRLRSAPKRPALSMSRAGLPDGALVTVEKVNPVQSRAGLAGELTRTQCRIVYGSVFLESGNHARAETNLASDCEIMGGNSGSALLAANGTVRGVIFAILPDERARKHLDERRLGVAPERIAPLNFAANLACLAWPGRAAPADCANVKPDSRETLAFRAALPAREKALPALGRYDWKVEAEAEGAQFRARPYCTRLNRAPKKAVPHYLVELQPTLDRYARAEAKVTEVPASAATETRGLPVCAR
jgi:ribosomal protein S28E/S33